MTTYKWKGSNAFGCRKAGLIDADSIRHARSELQKKGIVTRTIAKKRAPLWRGKNKKITSTDVALFSRHMATLIGVGLPLLQSLSIIASGHTNPQMKRLTDALYKHIEDGHTFSESLQRFPRIFNGLFCHLVHAGETSGTLSSMLEKLADYKEKMELLKTKIKKTLAYPFAVLLLACGVTALLLIVVVPQFEDLFEELGAVLPLPTRAVISLSNFLISYGYFFLCLAAFACYGFQYFIRHSKPFREAMDACFVKLFILGNLIKQGAIARFARTLSITYTAGLPLVDALTSVAGTTGNIVYVNATLAIREAVKAGQPMHLTMKKLGLFPSMVVQMVAIGEESGTLECMLNTIADNYENQLDSTVNTLSRLLEPTIMAILGILVGGMVIAMYLPLFTLGATI